MSGFIEGEDRTQATLFPERVDDYVAEDSPVRVVDVFIDDLDVSGLGFRTEPNATGRGLRSGIGRQDRGAKRGDGTVKKVRSPDA
jgi:hypothetical protein